MAELGCSLGHVCCCCSQRCQAAAAVFSGWSAYCAWQGYPCTLTQTTVSRSPSTVFNACNCIRMYPRTAEVSISLQKFAGPLVTSILYLLCYTSACSYQCNDLPSHNDMVAEYASIADALYPYVDLYLAETLSTVAEAQAALHATALLGKWGQDGIVCSHLAPDGRLGPAWHSAASTGKLILLCAASSAYQRQVTGKSHAAHTSGMSVADISVADISVVAPGSSRTLML